MRPGPLAAIAVGGSFLSACLSACGGAVGASSAPPAARPQARAAAHAAAARVTHQHVVPAGIPVERIPPPSGPAFQPSCPSRTTIATSTAPSVTARTRPEAGAPAIATFSRRNEQGAKQVFDVVSEATGAGGHSWYKVLLPLRPNDTLGYIPADRVRASWTGYWILVERSAFRLTLYRACDRAAEFPVGIGTGSTPTPVGYFYLQSLLQPPDPNGVYGAYAYGLSGYSAVIHDWRWGGLVGLHGTNDPSGIGHDVSHGCIRMLNRDITQLVRVLPLGTPVTIV
jgi:hypothetical protein